MAAAALLFGGSEVWATSFLDLSTWTNAAQCGGEKCVDQPYPFTSHYDILGSAGDGDYVISAKYSQTDDTYVNFQYTFVPSFDASQQREFAYYKVGSGNYVELNGTQQQVDNIYLPKNEFFYFKVTNVTVQPTLEVKNFQSVPAPLPVLGAGATFGWIRRRRAQLKARQSFHL